MFFFFFGHIFLRSSRFLEKKSIFGSSSGFREDFIDFYIKILLFTLYTLIYNLKRTFFLIYNLNGIYLEKNKAYHFLAICSIWCDHFFFSNFCNFPHFFLPKFWFSLIFFSFLIKSCNYFNFNFYGEIKIFDKKYVFESFVWRVARSGQNNWPISGRYWKTTPILLLHSLAKRKYHTRGSTIHSLVFLFLFLYFFICFYILFFIFLYNWQKVWKIEVKKK